MGARLTLGRQVISEWERGISVLRTRDIPRVSNILGVTTDYLLSGHEAPQHAALIAAIRRTTSDPRVLALVERA
jgi:transcriptional regulator with XRE-family HTH domain